MERCLVAVVRSIHRWQQNGVVAVDDPLAEEEPLEIRVNGTPIAVTMRSPGHDHELAAGFLWSEGLLEHPGTIAEIRSRFNVADVITSGGNSPTASPPRTVTSACGICGRSSLDKVHQSSRFVPVKNAPTISNMWLRALPDRLRDAQPDFDSTGGIHAAALAVPGSETFRVREDVGRHNAVDKLIGNALLSGELPLDRAVLLVSGRASFELVQKAVLAGIPVVCAIGASSSLAVDLAADTDTTLVGFLRPHRFNIYSAAWRINDEPVSHA